MPTIRFFRYLWAAPCTIVGLGLATLLFVIGATAKLRSGVLEVAFVRSTDMGARVIGALPIAAITFGHVVLAVTHADQDRLRVHERAHVAQYETWGALFFVAYPLSSLHQTLIGRHPYFDNWFEVKARAQAARLSR